VLVRVRVLVAVLDRLGKVERNKPQERRSGERLARDN